MVKIGIATAKDVLSATKVPSWIAGKHAEQILGLSTGIASPFDACGIEACSWLSEESFFCWALSKLD